MFPSEQNRVVFLEHCARKEGHDYVIIANLIENACLAVIRFVDFIEQIDNVISLAKFVLNVVILRFNTKLDEFTLERTGLFK